MCQNLTCPCPFLFLPAPELDRTPLATRLSLPTPPDRASESPTSCTSCLLSSALPRPHHCHHTSGPRLSGDHSGAPLWRSSIVVRVSTDSALPRVEVGNPKAVMALPGLDGVTDLQLYHLPQREAHPHRLRIFHCFLPNTSIHYTTHRSLQTIFPWSPELVLRNLFATSVERLTSLFLF